MPIPVNTGTYTGQAIAGATGAATVILGPVRQGMRITPTAIAVTTIGSTVQPVATWYKNSAQPQNFGSQTFTANGDTDNAPGISLFGGEVITVVFTGATVGAICYARCEYRIDGNGTSRLVIRIFPHHVLQTLTQSRLLLT